MALEPENRYQTMQEFVTSLQSIPSQPIVIKPILPTVPSVSPAKPQQPNPVLQSFSFETVKVNNQGKIISRQPSQAQYFTENLGNGIILEMVYIPGGTFLMGSPKTEAESDNDEKPQHPVTIQPFFMGKYAVTQAQWKVVTKLPRIERDLNPDCSHFKGDNRPVETVSWYDAVEFCARLSQKTGRNYRLPSEAEWNTLVVLGRLLLFTLAKQLPPIRLTITATTLTVIRQKVSIENKLQM
jgi:formylglycine-generating enzyme required for sulfatase activity